MPEEKTDPAVKEDYAVFEAPLDKFMGFKISVISEGYCELRVPIREELSTGHGGVHGGVYYIICDLATLAALSSKLGDNYYAVTTDINVSLLSSTDDGELIVKANVLRSGKRLAFVEAKVFDDKDKLLCAARVTKAILPKA
ncbi:MAG TPA: PaaI family thioesterase [Desulfitobacteriaceae bacterium]|jgi:uncharacterized protein (TIGR00369 family)|nr:PaaI family thioesterase [Desulfitobacteriaceae bacterium]